MIRLKIIDGPSGVGSHFPLETGNSVLIGRSDKANIQLLSNGVSKLHCKLTALPGGFVEIEDLNSSNGTFLNGILVRKSKARIGDTIGVHRYSLEVGIEAPKVSTSFPTAGNAALQMESSFEAQDVHISETPTSLPGSSQDQSFAQKTELWLERAVFPWADRLSEAMPIRTLLVGGLLLWSFILIYTTASPFSSVANERIVSESIQVARLYARQLARLNQQAIIDQNYSNLISSLDTKNRPTPGVMESLVLDAVRGQILAPGDRLGEALPSPEAQIAIAQDREHVQINSQGIAAVSVPIRARTAEGDKTFATAYVVFDPKSGTLSLADTFTQVINSLLIGALVGLFLLVFFYRWIEGSLQRLAQSLESTVRDGTGSGVTSPVLWPPLVSLSEKLNTLASRAASAGGGVESQHLAAGTWAQDFANTNVCSALAMGQDGIILAWNAKLEQLVGTRASMAIGQTLASISPDVGFENAIQAAVNNAFAQPGVPTQRGMEWAGVSYTVVSLAQSGQCYVQLAPAGGS